jgi:putative NADH-flavin reductase
MIEGERTAAVFGATGRAGALVVDELLARGWSVRALARTAGRVPVRTDLEVVEGDARNRERVLAVVSGADVVFCCLGMADISVPATDFSDSVRTIVSAAEETAVRRLIAIASVGVLDDPTGGYRSKQLPEVFRNVAAEHLRNLETLRASSLDWTLMCPATLREDIPPGRSRVAYEDLPGDSGVTGYRDLALTMVDLIEVRESFRKRVCVLSEP